MRAGWVLAGVLCAFAQPAAFEVASVKPAAPAPMDGGESAAPPSPNRFLRRHANLGRLIVDAYALQRYQLIGPDWLWLTSFDIDAKMPPDTPPNRQMAMLQSLLAERFQLAVHRETKELPIYDLTVDRHGLRMRPSAVFSGPEAPQAPPRVTYDPEGIPIFAPDGSREMRANGMANCYTGWRILREPLDDFADALSIRLDRAVHNRTALAGKYDITLHWILPGCRSEPGPDLPTALDEQLGLKLQPGKGPVEVLVVDHVEKTPTAN